MKEYQTVDKLEEKVYSVCDDFNEDEIINEINAFIKELISRKRDDPFEGGLQAGGVILPNQAAFKISEENGNAPHCHIYETLAQYINGDTKFSNTERLGYLYERMSDPNAWINISKRGFEVRLLIGQNHIIGAINTYSNEINSFQLRVVKILVKCIRKLYEQGIFKIVSVNYTTHEDQFVVDADKMTEDDFDRLENILNNRIEEQRVYN